MASTRRRGDTSSGASASDGEGDEQQQRRDSHDNDDEGEAKEETTSAAGAASNGAAPAAAAGNNKYRRNKSAMANVCRRWRVSGMCAWLPDRCGFQHPPHLAKSVAPSARNTISDTTVTASSLVLCSTSTDEEWSILLRPVVIDSKVGRAEKIKGNDTRGTDIRAARKVIERKLFQSERAIHLMIEEDGYVVGDDVVMDAQMNKLKKLAEECKVELAKPIALSGNTPTKRPAKKDANAAVESKKKDTTTEEDGEDDDDAATGNGEEAKKRKRTVRIGRARKAYAFIQWIVDTFTIAALQPRAAAPLPAVTSRVVEPGGEEVWPRVGVVDVAGGRGDVSYVLAAFYRIRSLIIDPRAPSFRKMSHSLRRAQTKHAHNVVASVPSAVPAAISTSDTIAATVAEASSTASGATTVIAPSSVESKRSKFEFIPPQHVGLCFPLPFVLPSTTTTAPTGAVALVGSKSVARGHPLSTFYHKYVDESNAVDIKSVTGTDATAKLAQLRRHLDRALDSCSIVIGLHPDQATEPLIDFCLLNNRSFAVLPCCVFPSLFPLRHTSSSSASSSCTPASSSSSSTCCETTTTTTNGSSHSHASSSSTTTTIGGGHGHGVADDRESSHHHAQFCRYLASKDPRIRVTALPIRGRNIVVYAHLTHPAPLPAASAIPSTSSA